MKSTLTPGWPPPGATGIQVSHVASHRSLNEHEQPRWPWVLSWSFRHPISIYFTCLPPLLWLTLPPHPISALPGRTPSSRTLRGLPKSSASDPLSISQVVSISDTHHSQIQPCLPFVSLKLGSVSLRRKRALKRILHSWAWLLAAMVTFMYSLTWATVPT